MAVELQFDVVRRGDESWRTFRPRRRGPTVVGNETGVLERHQGTKLHTNMSKCRLRISKCCAPIEHVTRLALFKPHKQRVADPRPSDTNTLILSHSGPSQLRSIAYRGNRSRQRRCLSHRWAAARRSIMSRQVVGFSLLALSGPQKRLHSGY